jgi:hypothetical protein
MKTISLKQAFESVGYTPAPLPSVESEVLDAKQLGKILERFAEDDAAFFNFLVGIWPSCYLPTPLPQRTAQNCFNRYAYMKSPEFEIGLPSQPLLNIIPGDTSGWRKKEGLLNLISQARHCRDVIKRAESPSSAEVITSLCELSAKATCSYGTYDSWLNLSDAQFDQIKNLALPANPLDPLLQDDISMLDYIHTRYTRQLTLKRRVGRAERDLTR